MKTSAYKVIAVGVKAHMDPCFILVSGWLIVWSGVSQTVVPGRSSGGPRRSAGGFRSKIAEKIVSDTERMK
jgi:hypothetical protein